MVIRRVVFKIAFALGLVGASFSFSQTPQTAKYPQVVAQINGEQITGAELENVLKMMGPSPIQVPANTKRQMERDALAMLIDDMLMQQFIRQSTTAVPEEVVTQKVTDFSNDLRKQGKSLQDFCKETMQTEAQLKRTFRLKLQWANFAASKITEEQVQNYYIQNKDFFDNNTINVSLIIMRTPPGTSAGERAKLKDTMGQVKAVIASGKMDFATAAKTYSQDPSGPQGGNLGFIPRKFALEEPLAVAAFRLAPGQMSDVLETEMGIHLIRVNDRKQGQPSDFKKIKEDVREFCSEEFFQETLARQRKAARIQVMLQ